MGLFGRNTNRDAETMVATLKRLVPDMEIGVSIIDGQACVSLPPSWGDFSYLVPRKGLWALFEGLSSAEASGFMPPTTVVVGSLKDDPEMVARQTLAWHAQSRFDKMGS